MKQIHKEKKVAKEETTKVIEQLEHVMAVKIPTKVIVDDEMQNVEPFV
jgi:hypothetical protein